MYLSSSSLLASINESEATEFNFYEQEKEMEKEKGREKERWESRERIKTNLERFEIGQIERIRLQNEMLHRIAMSANRKRNPIDIDILHANVLHDNDDDDDDNGEDDDDDDDDDLHTFDSTASSISGANTICNNIV